MDESRLVPQAPGELEEIAERLVLVAAGGLAAEAIEIEAMPLPPQHERQDASDGRIAMRERKGICKAL